MYCFQFISKKEYLLKNTVANCLVVTVLASIGLTKKGFGHHTTSKIFFSKSPSAIPVPTVCVPRRKICFSSIRKHCIRIMTKTQVMQSAMWINSTLLPLYILSYLAQTLKNLLSRQGEGVVSSAQIPCEVN